MSDYTALVAKSRQYHRTDVCEQLADAVEQLQARVAQLEMERDEARLSALRDAAGDVCRLCRLDDDDAHLVDGWWWHPDAAPCAAGPIHDRINREGLE